MSPLENGCIRLGGHVQSNDNPQNPFSLISPLSFEQ